MFIIKNEKAAIKWALFFLMIISFCICLYAVLKFENKMYLGSLEKMNDDDVRYIKSAWELLDKGMLTYAVDNTPTIFIMPGHPIILAGFMKVWGRFNGITAFRIYQVILQTLSVYLIFLISKRIFKSSIAAITACIIDVFYIPEITTSGLILTEGQFKFLLLLLIFISIHALEKRSQKYYIAAGILWSIEVMLRPAIAMFPIVMIILWIIYKIDFRECLRHALAVAAILALILTPWIIRNYYNFHRFIPLTLSSGDPFLLGVYVNYTTPENYEPLNANVDVIALDKKKLDMGKDKFLENFKKEPLQYMYWYTVGKTKCFWQYPFYFNEVVKIPFIYVQNYHKWILFFGSGGILLAFIKKIKSSYLLVATIAYFNLVHLPYYTFSRYAYPVMPFLIIFAGYSLAGGFSYLYNRILVKRGCRISN